ncbi:NAD+ synthase [bacterium]|nr:NAD+ synthase [bacterium]
MSSSELKKPSLAIDCEQVSRVLINFIRTEVRKVGFERVVLGLSGGIDSSLSAALAVRALGRENVLGVFMPYESSNPSSLADARLLAEYLGLRSQLCEITPMVKPYLEANPGMDQLRRGNVMARMRMIVLYDISAAERALVLGTSNKTEYLLGYSTLWGDMACALNPLGDLYKNHVRQLSRFLEIPAPILQKKPSADLWEGQTDEDEFGFTYDDADQLLYLLIDRRFLPEEVERLGYDRRLIDILVRKVRTTQYKRHLPLIAKLSQRTINRDFRYPRDWGL